MVFKEYFLYTLVRARVYVHMSEYLVRILGMFLLQDEEFRAKQSEAGTDCESVGDVGHICSNCWLARSFLFFFFCCFVVLLLCYCFAPEDKPFYLSLHFTLR